MIMSLNLTNPDPEAVAVPWSTICGDWSILHEYFNYWAEYADYSIGQASFVHNVY